MDNTVYALVQCTRDLSPDDYKKCLGSATEEILDVYYHSIGVRLLSQSCYLRYELYAFYMGESDSMANNKNGEVVLGSYACYYALNRRHKKSNKDFVQAYPRKFPYIDLASIKISTNNSSDSNKLGEGGFGPVYKGALRDGEEVTVKRLSICSEQGSEEFTNDVLLILKLQHYNLVKLLGFCVDGKEKILVDLKASNILLDLNMNPKISDFEMARIFAGTESQANTATIVGTQFNKLPEASIILIVYVACKTTRTKS
ncbi:cysteine-rich receptor-like protein kinase 25 [Humulus lupulus]|uniref:cysteine-rich receptor-like protein kinase 25 n=1 Tax=Humulus lupulus TaxID=3486 RepID=UPI002B412782|nr:cysteine-rich receptor-like protein kinase 25 [Humulus lupulus]